MWASLPHSLPAFPAPLLTASAYLALRFGGLQNKGRRPRTSEVSSLRKSQDTGRKSGIEKKWEREVKGRGSQERWREKKEEKKNSR